MECRSAFILAVLLGAMVFVALLPAEDLPEEIPTGPLVEETLEQAWTLAVDADQLLAAKRWDRDAAESHLNATAAMAFPDMWLNGAYTVRDDRLAFQSSVPGLPDLTFPSTQREFAGYGALVRVPLYTSGRLSNAIESAAAGVQASQWEVDASRLQLKLLVTQEYLAVLRAQRDLELADSNFASLQSHARVVEKFFENKRNTKNDLLAAQVALANAQQQQIQTTHRLEVARAAYNRRLLRPLTAEVLLADVPLSEADPPSIDTLMIQALEFRPELSQLAARTAVLLRRAESIMAENRPQVELRGAYDFQENRYQTPQGLTSAALAVQWNAFDFGRHRHQASSLQRQAEGLRRLHADLASRIQLDLRQAWLSVHENLRLLAVTRLAIEQAEENSRVNAQLYQAGRATNTEVLDAERLRLESHRNHWYARYDFIYSQYRLQFAAGAL